MKARYIRLGLISALLSLATACSSSSDDSSSGESSTPTGSDLNQYTSGNKVMMQAFYWDVPAGGTWYDVVKEKVSGWKTAGINLVWLPVPGKGNSGGSSMGYDAYDYFDVGEFDQKGSTETRFGSKTELTSLLSTIKSNQMIALADIVINHNIGGELENNPSGSTYTKYTPASGKFNRTYLDFTPYNGNTDSGESGFGEQLDLAVTQVQNALWATPTSVAEYYKSLGFEGWRFDFVKGYAPIYVKKWNDATQNLFSVGEYWDGNTDLVNTWVTNSGSNAFDFPLFYNLEQAFDSQKDLTKLSNNALIKVNPTKAVTFVTNHDADSRDANEGNWIATDKKLYAYAYIMTHPGLPCVFYTDYESRLSKTEMNNLLLINRTIAKGDLKILAVDADEYIAERMGDATNPGLVIYINTSQTKKTRTVTTHWLNKTLFDYTNHSIITDAKYLPTTNASGTTTLSAPGNSYAIWSVQ